MRLSEGVRETTELFWILQIHKLENIFQETQQTLSLSFYQ